MAAAPSNPQQDGSLGFIFPGQGSQFPGMGKELLRDERCERLLRRADEVLGYSLSNIMESDDGPLLNRTIHTQPAIFVYTMAVLAVIRRRSEIAPAIAAGHSLGEYSALAASGALSFEQALEIISVRAKEMDCAQPEGTCGMAAVMGLPRDDLNTVLSECANGSVLEAANFNAPDQVVISGHIQAIDRFMVALKKFKRARAVKLAVSSAFHTALMEPARLALDAKFRQVELQNLGFPVVANVNSSLYPDAPSQMKQLLIDQVVHPVLWEDCIKTMLEQGVKTFVEIGPGKVLTGLMKRIDKQSSCLNISCLDAANSLEGLSA